MSFLNPVNEPVLRFSSTDAGAPQIDYNSRTAGDVKSVLKACLVIGYGTKEGAGWSAVNETATVAEFVSPSAAMSDYRLGIDDTSTSSTTWRDVNATDDTAVNMGAAVTKSSSAINKTHADNGWDMLVTPRGFLLIENIVNTAINGVVSRITYYGQLKKTVVDTDLNISWWCIGHGAPAANDGMPTDFFSTTPVTSVDKYYRVGSNVRLLVLSLSTYKLIGSITSISNVNFAENWYLEKDNNTVAQQPGVKLMVKNNGASTSQNQLITIAGRDFIQCWPIRGSASFSQIDITSHALFLMPLDYWEY